MAGKNSPLNVAVVKEKIDKGEVKVKGVKAKQNKAHSVSGVNGKSARRRSDKHPVEKRLGVQDTHTSKASDEAFSEARSRENHDKAGDGQTAHIHV